MQRVQLWEVTPDEKLNEIPGNRIDLEKRLEDWLATDISILDPNLLVIDRQVRTDFGGAIDLLCLDSAGNTVVIELKKGQTPRYVTAQVLDYASWVKELSAKELTLMADRYLAGSRGLDSAFRERFEKSLPDELNREHRSLIVAESMDASTERIVRYLSDMNVPINVATIQHFKDRSDRSIIAQVYLIEPEETEARSRRTTSRTVNGLQAMADASDIGTLYRHMRDGVRGILSAQPYTDRVWYRLRRNDGSVRTVLIVSARTDKESRGLQFTVHAARLRDSLGVEIEKLRTWLPPNSKGWDLSGWSGSSEDERSGAPGFTGYFNSAEEIDRFLAGLRDAASQ